MKKFFFKKIVWLLFLSILIYPVNNGEAEEPIKKGYAQKGTVEIEGLVGFSSSGDSGYHSYFTELSFGPVAHYFFVDNIHIGATPRLIINHTEYNFPGSYTSSKSTTFSLSPELILGYTFTITPNVLYFDIAGLINYNYIVYESSSQPEQHKEDYAIGLGVTLKYLIQNALINTGFHYMHNNEKSKIGYHAFGFILSYSIFF